MSKRAKYARRQATIGGIVAFVVASLVGGGWLEVACWTAFGAIYAVALVKAYRLGKVEPRFRVVRVPLGEFEEAA